MAAWVIWLIIAVLLGIAEIFTLTAALGLLGGAAVIASVFAAIGLPVPLQLLVFTLSAAAGIVVAMAVLLLANSFAIWLRNRYQQRS